MAGALHQQIVAAYATGKTQDELAADFGVGMWTVRKALANAGALPSREEATRRRIARSHTPEANAKRAQSNRRPLLERFNRHVIRNENGCWGWTGARDGHGYPQMRVEGRCVNATHVSLYLAGERRPSTESCALHSCDNPECSNPAHLRWGTMRENTRDAMERGRLNLSGLELGRVRK